MSVSVWRRSVVLNLNITCCLADVVFLTLCVEGSNPSPEYSG